PRLMADLEAGLSAVPGGAGDLGSANSIPPDAVAHLPGPLYDLVVGAYNDALVPLFLWIAPLAIVGGVIACFIDPKPLATSNEPVERTVLEDDEGTDERMRA